MLIFLKTNEIYTIQMKYLLVGSNGFLGSYISKRLGNIQDIELATYSEHICSPQDAVALIERIRPERLVCCVGRTNYASSGNGPRNIDSLEDLSKFEDMSLANLYVPIWLAKATMDANVPMLYFGTGCIYTQEDVDTSLVSEELPINFFGSSYSRMKGLTDTLLRMYPNVLNARIRMPILGRFSGFPHDFLDKLLRYPNIHSVRNSMTIVPNVVPILLGALHEQHAGTVNAVNPNALTHKELLESFATTLGTVLRKHYVASNKELNLLAQRSNVRLDTSKLETIYASLSETTKRMFHIDPLRSTQEALEIYVWPCKKYRLLVTGGSGFIGAEFVKTAKTWPFVDTVLNLDLKEDLHETEIKLDLSKSSSGSETTVEVLTKALQQHKITHVIHFAAKTHVDQSFDGPQSLEYTRTNVLGTHQLLEAIRNTTGQYIELVHMSTDEVYGSLDHTTWATEQSTVLVPTNPYAASKVGAECLVQAYGTSFGLPWKMLRCNNVYGPTQMEKVIPTFIKQCALGSPITIHGSGLQRRMFIHVQDVVQAIQCVILQGSNHEIYNIGSRDEISVLDLAHVIRDLVSQKTHVKTSIVHVEDRPFNDQRYAVNDDKLKALGFTQKIPFQSGLAQTVEENLKRL